MGGIVGTLCEGPAAPRLIEALRRLPHGACGAELTTLEGDRLERFLCRDDPAPAASAGRAGVASAAQHRRPPGGSRLAVACHGVLQNTRALKRRLIAAGRRVEGDVVESLVNVYLERGQPPAAAVASALPHLKGDISLICLFAGEDDLLVGAARGAPLAAGFGASDVWLSSNSAALAGLAVHVNALETGDLAILRRDRLSILDADGMRMERPAASAVSRPNDAPDRAGASA